MWGGGGGGDESLFALTLFGHAFLSIRVSRSSKKLATRNAYPVASIHTRDFHTVCSIAGTKMSKEKSDELKVEQKEDQAVEL
jgi:hypothetical protein